MSNPFEAAVKALDIHYEKAARPVDFSIFTGVTDAPKDIQTLYRDIPCQAACPAKTNVPAYIQAIAEGDPDKAYRINLEDNVFPGALGRVCTRPCEDRCRHKWTNVNGPVHICHLKRAAGDHGQEDTQPLPAWFGASGKTIAVVGGGPAGLTAARELKRYGHDVTVFERESYLGGMMVMGIPKFRLPREVVDKETKLIADSGIKVEYNVDVDARKMAELAAGYDAVLVATGAMRPSDLSLPGLAGGQEVPGLAFMQKYNFGQIGDMTGQSVVIVGGGFTAVDCARSCARAARRLVGVDGRVAIMYRRTEGQMSAKMDELDAMRDENIEIDTLVSPVSARMEKGKLKGVTFRRNMLGDVQPGHTKPPITPIENSDFEVPADLLIVAIGQVRQMDIMPSTMHATEGYLTATENVFVAGDFKDGGADVITAVNDAKQAADAIDLFLMGKQRRKTHVAIELVSTNGETGRLRDHDIQQGDHMPHLPMFSRDGLAEVELGFDQAMTGVHATRCYLCHYKFEINQDKCIHCDWCIKVAPRKNCIKKVSRLFKDELDNVKTDMETTRSHEATYIWIDSDECIRCGACLRRCPTDAITLRKMSLNTTTISEFDLLRKKNVVEEPAFVDLG